MTNRQQLIVAAMLTLLTAACNNSTDKSGYTIEGTTTALADGDHLLLIDDEGMTVDTLTVKGGKFSYSGAADTVVFYTLAVEKDGMNNVSFFTEPGTIKISIGEKAGQSTVGGTTANDATQQLMASLNPIYEKIQELESTVYSDTTQNYDQWALMERYNQLASEIYKKYNEAAEKNIDNELGFKLLVNFIDPSENAELMRQLIAKLPDNFRQRQQVADLEASLKAFESVGIGQKIQDFSLSTPDGTELSILNEVAQHKLTILDFWASWCGPCRKEMPFMKELYAEYRPKGLGIIGISLDESETEWTRAIDELKIGWPQVSDLQGGRSGIAQTFQISAIPFMYVLDSEGKIVQKGLRGEQLKQFISSQLK